MRAPKHELTIARYVSKTRRCIVAQPPGWALTQGGIRSLSRYNVVAGQAWPAKDPGRR
ncbi:hypothetical protein GB927_026950 [Shinella sp. CPCC 100929]|uniref:Uncharacterized protein n=1 Tax=Shinella lacus TaxID=2654216 RepID=A0ABT1RET4_9HYPH|nr:hypothetical protein [Shinella lacus]MCQ4633700.1 hypothetical protein [Shinella lacus]